jgi:hypothetical protein
MSIKNNFINEIIDVVIDEVSKDEIKNKMSTYLIEPSITYIFHRFYPYIVMTFVIFILILLMAITIVFLLIRK